MLSVHDLKNSCFVVINGNIYRTIRVFLYIGIQDIL